VSELLAEPTGPVDDIFAFCNRLAWQAGGPVLMYDTSWGVVAYSTLNQAIDETRRAVILRRVVPNEDTEQARIANELIESHSDAFEFESEPGKARRVVSVIRLLDVHVGSIWIAGSAGELHPDAMQMAREAAKHAALYFQIHDDARKREADRFARMLLGGSQDEALMAQYLGVPATAHFRVVAVCHGANADLRDQIRPIVGVIASQQQVDHIIMDGETCLYVAFYVPASTPQLSVAVRAFARDIAAADDRLYVGAGGVATRVNRAPRSRADADKVVAYLRRAVTERVGSVNTLRTQISLMRMVEMLEGHYETLPGTLHALDALEPGDRDEALRTLDVYFTHPGNASEAARQLLVHPNTFRYRLAKVADMLGIDLDDRDTRLLVELDLLRHRYGSDTSRP
jgi:sugar diacid utilization regulator